MNNSENTPEQITEKQENPTPETTASLPDKKKNALIRYMAVLFGVAFLLVLLSLFIQMRDSRETISDLSEDKNKVVQNALLLQEKNENLTMENNDLRAQLQGANKDLEQLEETEADLKETQIQLEAAEEALETADAEAKETALAWNLLTEAMEAQEEDQADRRLELLEQLEPLKDRLTDAGRAIYEKLASLRETE